MCRDLNDDGTCKQSDGILMCAGSDCEFSAGWKHRKERSDLDDDHEWLHRNQA